MSRPLEGVRIVDFTHVMAGPFATHFLALLGAEVIKIEPLEGDHFRYYGRDPAYAGMSPAFIAANLGKRSVVLDLKAPEGKQAALDLVATADVVAENFRPGVIDRLGLGYEVCKALRPGIIFCSVSGYGQAGPFKDYPALDQIIQATSGMMTVNGRAEDPPLRVGVPIVDTYAGTLGAMAILAALLGRERGGEGRRIDVSMFDASLVLLTSAVTPFLVAGQQFPRTGNQGYSREPTAACFTAGDGALISLGVTRQPMFEALCKEMGRPEWINDPRFANQAARNVPGNADALVDLLEAEFKKRPGLEWETQLSAVGAPCGLVRDIRAGCDLEQLQQRQVKQRIDIPGLPTPSVEVLNAGFQYDVGGPEVGAPPQLGEHTDAVLASIGYDAAKLKTLRDKGVTAPKALGAKVENL